MQAELKKIRTITKKGVIYDDLQDICAKICRLKNIKFFRVKVNGRIKVDGKWYAPLNESIKAIRSCGRKIAKQFIRDNQNHINKLNLDEDNNESEENHDSTDTKDEHEDPKYEPDSYSDYEYLFATTRIT